MIGREIFYLSAIGAVVSGRAQGVGFAIATGFAKAGAAVEVAGGDAEACKPVEQQLGPIWSDPSRTARSHPGRITWCGD